MDDAWMMLRNDENAEDIYRILRICIDPADPEKFRKSCLRF
jgi:hypothetical protein